MALNDSDLASDCLSARILDKYTQAVFDQPPQDFLPQNYISELITKDAIIDEFNGEDESTLDLTKEEDQGLLTYILEHSRKVFATAVICEISDKPLYKLMKKFESNGIQDKSLPLNKEVLLSSWFPGKYWSHVKLNLYLDKQFVFLAPVFSRSVFKLDLNPKHIFPFTWVSPHAKEGTFSQVYQVKIHDAHQDLTDHGLEANVAIKEIKDFRLGNEQDNVNKDWEAEAKALDEISGLNHVNIIQRIAAITRGSKRYFMFQWANGGSLRDFWESCPQPILDPTFVKEVVHQFLGLADALHELHVYNGGSYRHGDLKPENILRFKDGSRIGVLKIADMGLAKHHFVPTQERPATSTKYGTVQYEPPEIFTQRLSAAGRSRLYDVWSLGCITLELIIWLLYGYEELRSFNESLKDSSSVGNASPYYQLDLTETPPVASVHERVQACMKRISKDQESAQNSALKDLLNLVETRLLVVPLPDDRPSSLNVDQAVPPPEDRFSSPNPDEVDLFAENRLSSSNPGLVFSPPDEGLSSLNSNQGTNIVVTDTDAPRAYHATLQPPGSAPRRATAKQCRDTLEKITGKGELDSSYWYTGISRQDLSGLTIPSRGSPVLIPPTAAPGPNLKADRANMKTPVLSTSHLAPEQRENVNIF